MKGREKIRFAIQELLLCGYTQERIATKLNISISSVYRTVKKIRDSNKQWLSDLAERNMANVFRESLEGFLHDMAKLNDLLEEPDVKKDIKLQLQIRKEITTIRTEYTKQLVSTPMVWSLDVFTKNHTIHPMEQPIMNGLGGISGVKSK